MKEFEVYDKMMEEYYDSMSLSILPLSSWEFYGEHNAFLKTCKSDLDMLNKMSKKWDFEDVYYNELIYKKSVIVVTTTDIKIIYATNNIKGMSGYSVEEVIGKSPKIFQGKGTDAKISKIIREAIDKEIPFEVSLINYKKDNTSYKCYIKGFPVKDKKGNLVNFIAFERAA